MKKIVLLLITVVTLTSCKKNSAHGTATKTIKEAEGANSTKRKVLGDYMNCEDYFSWSPKQSEDADFFVRLLFKEDVTYYQIHGQCIYSFLTNYQHTGVDKIELIWSYKTDCLRNPGFLLKPNNIKHYPKPGDVFCEYSLINDTVIKVKYDFQEWASTVNTIAKDSIFPNYLYLEKQ